MVVPTLGLWVVGVAVRVEVALVGMVVVGVVVAASGLLAQLVLTLTPSKGLSKGQGPRPRDSRLSSSGGGCWALCWVQG